MSVAAAYERHKNLRLVSQELGMPVPTVYWQLRQQGVHVVGDKARYGSTTDKFANRTEREFERLVPVAINANLDQWQAKVDFRVGPLSVDVKASNFNSSRRWAFCVKKQAGIANFVACFAYGCDTEYRILLVPGEEASRVQLISVGRKAGKWTKYEVDPLELAARLQREAALFLLKS